jgi:hypothetical protein
MQQSEQDAKAILVVRSNGKPAAAGATFAPADGTSWSDWKLYETDSVAAAIAFLKEKAVPVVLCERTADWKALADVTDDLPRPPCVILSSRLADRNLWGDLLDLAAGMFSTLRPGPNKHPR